MNKETQHFINIVDKNFVSRNLDEQYIESKQKQLDEEIKSLWND